MRLDLSIVIVNWNVRELLDGCLASLYANIAELSFEVIVVDNASQDDSIEMVRTKYPAAVLIANQENAGFCRGNNQGIEISRGDFVALLNPDTEVSSGAMEKMISFLKMNPNVGTVGPTLIDSKGKTEPNGTRFPTLLHELGKMMRLQGLLGVEYDFTGYEAEESTKVWSVDVVCGACMLIRRAVLEDIGGLDEQLFMFYEETDFCLRAHRAGWRTVYLPAARIFHHWMGSVRQDEIRSARRFFRSRYLYFRKHHGECSSLLLRLFGNGMVLFRIIKIRLVRVREYFRSHLHKIGSRQ